MNSAKDAGGRDRVRWSADKRTMYFDGRALEIKRWKKFVRDLLEDTEELLNQKLLFRQGKHIETVDLHQYIDDPNLSDAGHYFALNDVNALKGGRKRMLRNLHKSEKWNEMAEVKGDEISFDAAAVDGYESWVNKFLENMLILMNVTCGQSGRGTEISSLLYKNMMEGNRHILIEDGQVMFVSEYHKSMAVMDDVKVCVKKNLLMGIRLSRGSCRIG